MIALLVGVLYEATGTKWHILRDFSWRDCPLDTDREAYSTAVLSRRDDSEDSASEEEIA
jgi:hypothetical protein